MLALCARYQLRPVGLSPNASHSRTAWDDGSPAKNGAWDGAVEAANANKATADADAMVYLGTFNSGAAKVAIPINNRANLVQMGVVPLVFKPGEGRKSLNLDGSETYDIIGLSDQMQPRQEVMVRVHRRDGTESSFQAMSRADSPIDVEYLRHGGVLPFVLRNLMRA